VTARLVTGGERLLDVGCGDGALTVLVKDKYRKVYGVDISAEAIARAKERGVEAVRVNLNSETLPFEAGYFDTVSCLDVIEHVFDPRVLIREIYRVLRPGGEGFLSTPNIRFLRFLQSIILAGRFPKTSGDSTLYDGGHIHFFTFKDIELLLQGAGFRVSAKYGLTSEKARRQFKWRLLRAVLGQTFEREFMCVEALVQFQKPAEGVGVR
jgi:2-polyprenyl-6-hydroxyphenyl methylase/3-demethylubiquinone-9 3-methyltransferase